jgi:hypothetical protein
VKVTRPSPFLILYLALCLMFVGCASAPGGGAMIPLPAEAREHITLACEQTDRFAAKYIEYRPKVIENKEWIDELFPGLWTTLIDFDKNAPHYKAVIGIVCRLFAGDPTAQADLDAKKIELQRKGLDWNAIITGALKLAPLLL